MLPGFRKGLENVCNSYHLLNLILSLAFPLTKMVPAISRIIFGAAKTGLDSREREILLFLVIVVMWKSRKSANYLHALSIAYLFAKLANVVLFFRAIPLLGIIYCALCLLSFVLLSEPLPPESSKIHYFQGDDLRRTLDRDKSIVWVVEFFSTWSADCRYVAPVFSALSENYEIPPNSKTWHKQTVQTHGVNICFVWDGFPYQIYALENLTWENMHERESYSGSTAMLQAGSYQRSPSSGADSRPKDDL